VAVVIGGWQIYLTHKQGKHVKAKPKNIQQQARLPMVILEPAPRTPSGNLLGLTMKNIGDGAALNISVGSEPDSAIVPSLATEEARLLRIETAFHREKPPILVYVNNEYILFLDPSSARDTAVFTIQFQNIQQQSYFVEERITTSRWEVLRSGRIEGSTKAGGAYGTDRAFPGTPRRCRPESPGETASRLATSSSPSARALRLRWWTTRCRYFCSYSALRPAPYAVPGFSSA